MQFDPVTKTSKFFSWIDLAYFSAHFLEVGHLETFLFRFGALNSKFSVGIFRFSKIGLRVFSKKVELAVGWFLKSN